MTDKKKIVDTDEEEFRNKIIKAKTEEFLNITAREYKLPIEIIREVYEFCCKYPTIKDFCMDEKARKIWQKQYKYHEEIGGVEVISGKKEEEKTLISEDDKGKEPLKKEENILSS